MDIQAVPAERYNPDTSALLWALLWSNRLPAFPSIVLKLHPDTSGAHHIITAYGDAFVEVNGLAYTHSILVAPDQPVRRWPVSSFAALTHTHFQDLIQAVSRSDAIELLLFGSGAKLRFPPSHLIASFAERNIALETMDSHAACRTYNILVAEGRKVATALLIEPHV